MNNLSKLKLPPEVSEILSCCFIVTVNLFMRWSILNYSLK